MPITGSVEIPLSGSVETILSRHLSLKQPLVGSEYWPVFLFGLGEEGVL
jgi:hypothetical protein